eukprot:344568-Pleurochrysis_carterae.AAC.1
MREQCLAKIERRKLFHSSKREQSVNIIVCGFRRKRLALRSTIVDLVVVDVNRFEPRPQITD